jgi:hypothetical protein
MKDDLNRLSIEAIGKLFPVFIVEHDPEWKNLFLIEKQISIKIL